MNKQDVLDFMEGFLTVMFAGGTASTIAYGTVFPGWYPFLMGITPTLGLAVLAGVRKINAGRRAAP